MNLTDGPIELRKMTNADKYNIAELANNPKIAINLRDGFPHPYTVADAENFLNLYANDQDAMIFGIFYADQYCGNTGLHREKDVYRRNAELGYFIGEKFWNMGIATKAVKLIVNYGFENTDIVRIYAGVFDYNQASMRVLEKCGFTLEAKLKYRVFKNNVLCHEFHYSKLNPKFVNV